MARGRGFTLNPTMGVILFTAASVAMNLFVLVSEPAAKHDKQTGVNVIRIDKPDVSLDMMEVLKRALPVPELSEPAGRKEFKVWNPKNYFADRFEAEKTSIMRRSVYTHELIAQGMPFVHFNFSKSVYTPRCTEASVTVFKGPLLMGRCAALIGKEFVFAVNDFPRMVPDPRYCYDLYNNYFKTPLDTGKNLNQHLNLLDLFLPTDNFTLVSEKKLVPIMFLWGYTFPHTVKDMMPRVMLSLPYLQANPEAKLLLEYSPMIESFLRRMQIPASRVKYTKDKTGQPRSHYKPSHGSVYEATEELALPHCHPGPMSTGIYTKEIYYALRELLLRTPHLPEADRNLIVYVARDGGDNSKMRRIDNEEQLLDAVNATLASNEEMFTANGVRVPELVRFQGKGLSLDQSIEIFRRARVVFGPHGGGFYNLIFSAPGTRVIELTPDDYGKLEVARFSNLLDLDYHGYIKKGMSRVETFGDVDVRWMGEVLLYNYSPEISEFPEPVLPEEYVRFVKSELIEKI
eukprot:TRINITY_DN2827_c0_g1_i1.p1 TRINITY_DN2827_c0_g1~~TRINITY_DN2827_c0_g1_i1.p1  ORF type:complete len:516 (-),score=139.38 TRINITY_DN2827_c0_g1_i1:115-1662(-)